VGKPPFPPSWGSAGVRERERRGPGMRGLKLPLFPLPSLSPSPPPIPRRGKADSPPLPAPGPARPTGRVRGPICGFVPHENGRGPPRHGPSHPRVEGGGLFGKTGLNKSAESPTWDLLGPRGRGHGAPPEPFHGRGTVFPRSRARGTPISPSPTAPLVPSWAPLRTHCPGGTRGTGEGRGGFKPLPAFSPSPGL
jgi:hypothetical protein